MPGREPRFAAYAPHPAHRYPAVAAALAEATGDDVPVLAALQVRARGGSAEEWADRIREARRRDRSLVVTAKAAGETVGYASAAFFPEHPVDHAPAGCYLTGVTVDPDWRRRGIAGLLTRHRMAWAWERGQAAWCFVSADNRASLDLHGRVGFDRVASGASFQGVTFAAGRGWLLRAVPPRPR